MAEPGSESDGSLLRDLAHELRDALSPVSASLDLARLRNFDAETTRSVAERVERALQRAFATLDAFVLAEQCEQGTLELDSATIGVNDILQHARELLEKELRERCVFVPCTARSAVQADLRRSAEVLDALTRHAISLARAGSAIEVRAQAGEHGPEIHVAARHEPQADAGEDWFHSFRAAHRGRMALRTARCIMVLQQGSLELTRAAPDRYDFVLRFAGAHRPAEMSPSRDQPRAASPAIRPGSTRLIIVDDSAEVRRAYREALVPLGYTVTEAADAQQALSVLEATAPQVALIDIHLPQINGYRLAQAIRARAGSAVRLIMLSGMALDATTRRLSREAGFDDCVDKMAGPLALHRLLQQAPG